MLTAILSYQTPIAKLRRSKFRASFRLDPIEKAKIREIGLLELSYHIERIVDSKLVAPLDLQEKDGKQIPYNGDPIFKAMHATACCCRKCLYKWHRIPVYKTLDEHDKEQIVAIILLWIKKQLLKD